jgi:hypothetical protein
MSDDDYGGDSGEGDLHEHTQSELESGNEGDMSGLSSDSIPARIKRDGFLLGSCARASRLGDFYAASRLMRGTVLLTKGLHVFVDACTGAAQPTPDFSDFS